MFRSPPLLAPKVNLCELSRRFTEIERSNSHENIDSG
jgi:hypothetical protein